MAKRLMSLALIVSTFSVGCASSTPIFRKDSDIPTAEFKVMARQTEIHFQKTGQTQIEYRTAHGSFQCNVKNECISEHGTDECIQYTLCLALAD